MAGYNLYELSEDGELTSLESYVFDEAKNEFSRAALPPA
jgi:hypothetical protein